MYGPTISLHGRKGRCFHTGNSKCSLEGGHTQRKLAAWNRFHKTGNYDLMQNVILNSKSHAESHETAVSQLLQHELSRTVSHNFSFVAKTAALSPEDGDSMIHLNASIHIRVYTASQPTTTSSSSPPREPYISPVCWPARKCLDQINILHETTF
jgi:hypothetical protein